MKEQHVAAKLRERRELLGYSQDYMAAKMNITQSGYSWVENGKIKFTGALILKIKTIEGFQDFDKDSAEGDRESGHQQSIVMKWPWGKRWYYIFIAFVGIVSLDQLKKIGDEFSSAFLEGYGPGFDISAVFTMVFVFSLFFLIYWLCWMKKWW